MKRRATPRNTKARTGHCVRCGGEILDGELLHLEVASCVHRLNGRLAALEQAVRVCDREDFTRRGKK